MAHLRLLFVISNDLFNLFSQSASFSSLSCLSRPRLYLISYYEQVSSQLISNSNGKFKRKIQCLSFVVQMRYQEKVITIIMISFSNWNFTDCLKIRRNFFSNSLVLLLGANEESKNTWWNLENEWKFIVITLETWWMVDSGERNNSNDEIITLSIVVSGSVFLSSCWWIQMRLCKSVVHLCYVRI